LGQNSVGTWVKNALAVTPVADIGRWLQRVVRGYFNYHAVPGNLRRLSGFRLELTRAWRQSLLRRSQKHRLPWSRFKRLVKAFVPYVRLAHPYPAERFRVKT
jgi:hypothetical protein